MLRAICIPWDVLLARWGPESGQGPPAPTAPTGLHDLKSSHRRGCFSKMLKWKIEVRREGVWAEIKEKEAGRGPSDQNWSAAG